jgi:hypothetical protein
MYAIPDCAPGVPPHAALGHFLFPNLLSRLIKFPSRGIDLKSLNWLAYLFAGLEP